MEPVEDTSIGLLKNSRRAVMKRGDFNFLSSSSAFFSAGIFPQMNMLAIFPFLIVPIYAANTNENAIIAISAISIAYLCNKSKFIAQQLKFCLSSQFVGPFEELLINITEVMVCIIAVAKSHTRLMQLYLLGCVLSRLTLSLGAAFLFGNLHMQITRFYTRTITLYFCILLATVTFFVLPTILEVASEQRSDAAARHYARGQSFLLLTLYTCFVILKFGKYSEYFSTKHVYFSSDLSNKGSSGPNTPTLPFIQGGDANSAPAISSNIRPNGPSRRKLSKMQKEREIRAEFDAVSAEDVHSLSTSTSSSDIPSLSSTSSSPSGATQHEMDFVSVIFYLVVIVVFLLISASALVSTVATQLKNASTALPSSFVSAVLLPLTTHALLYPDAILQVHHGHATACLHQAVDASSHLLIAVYPFFQLWSWWTVSSSSLEITYSLGAFETAALSTVVLAVLCGFSAGSAHWLLGAGLLALYLAIASGFYGHENDF